MARITPGSTALIEFEDQEPYRVRIKEIEDIVEQTHPETGKKSRVIPITWELVDDTDVTIKDWVGLTLNNTGNGQTSKLRQLLNALAERPKDTPVQWFDDDDNSWSYDGEEVDSALTVGLEAILRGETRERKDKQGKRFAVISYASAKKGKAKPKPRPAPDDDDDGEGAPF